MKRKVVKHGDSTLTISLPSKWVMANNIKQGQHLNVESSKGILIISNEEKHFDSITTDLSKDEEWAIRKILRHLYVSGYDEININFSNPQQLSQIRKGLDVLTGMEVMESKPNYCKLRCMISIDESEYEITAKRMLNLVLTQLEYFLEDCKKGNSVMWGEVLEIFFTFSKLCNLSRRLINKKNIFDIIQSKYAYDFLNGLMEISLFIKYSYGQINKKGKVKLTEKELEFISKTVEFFSGLISAYNTLSKEKIKDFFIQREKMFDNVLEILNDKNPIITHYFLMILRNMTSIGNHILMQNLDIENKGKNKK